MGFSDEPLMEVLPVPKPRTRRKYSRWTDYLCAIRDGEEEPDRDLVRIALKMVDFENAKLEAHAVC